MESPTRSALLFCSCSGSCPSMDKIDFWALTERVRVELGDKVEFLALHPRLCEEDGERFMGQLLTPAIRFVTAACAEKRQEKLLREGFAKGSVPMDGAHWTPISMGGLTTDQVFEKIRAAMDPPAVQAPAAGG